MQNKGFQVVFYWLTGLFISHVLFSILWVWFPDLYGKYNFNMHKFSSSSAFFLLILLIIIFLLIYLHLHFFKKYKLPDIFISLRFVKILIFLAASISIVLFLIKTDQSRYNSGSLTGFYGLLYFTFIFLFMLISTVFFLNHSHISFFNFFALGFSYLLCIDEGFGPWLFLLSYCSTFLILKYNPNYRFIFVLTFSLSLMFLIFADLLFLLDFPKQILSLQNFFSYIFYRFSINTLSLLQFINGMSYFSEYFYTSYSYLELLVRAFEQRFDLIFSGTYDKIYPRNVSEAAAFDFNREYRGGSSSGIFFGSIIGGVLSFYTIIFVLSLFVFYFNKMNVRKPFFLACTSYFFFSNLFAAPSEILVVISPTFFYLNGFIFASFLRIKNV